MELSGLHLLLTYQCTFECEHCFVWGSPWQTGTMTLKDIREILRQAEEAGTIRSIYFEGGEPFLYYSVLRKAVQLATEMGFKVGIVSNAYWATNQEDAIEWLTPFAGLVEDLSVSSDLFHYSEKLSQQARYASEAAEHLGIPIGVITVANPEPGQGEYVEGQLPLGESSVMYRGRAAEKLVQHAQHQPWESFTECPFEDLRDPGRVHLDPFGNLHVCQGISVANLFETPLKDICQQYDPEAHPIVEPLLHGGPAELARRYHSPDQERYADACHLCYQTRRDIRDQFPHILTPEHMYTVVES